MAAPTFGTRTDLGQESFNSLQQTIAEENAKKSEKQLCQEKGWFWDELSQTCISPLEKKEEVIDTPTTFKEGEVIAEQDTGRPSGIVKDGKTFLGLPREDIENISQKQQAEVAPISGAQTVQQRLQQEQEQQRLQQLVSTIGTIGGLQQAQEADINFSQALTAGTIGSLPSILASVGAGITGGAISGAVGGPVGVVGGAIIGAIAGVARGIMGNIKEQQKGELQAADIELTNARTNMRQLAMLASQDPQNADVYIAQYNAQLTRVHQARRQTKAEVSGDLNAWIEDGREQLADFDAFLQPGGIADIYGQKLQVSLLTGAPIDMSGMEFLP